MKIGREMFFLSDALGMFGSGNQTNENEVKLINLAEENQLKIANTFYMKKTLKKWTWQSPDKNVKNEIDYFLVSDLSIVKDVCLKKELNFPSDHRAKHYLPKI